MKPNACHMPAPRSEILQFTDEEASQHIDGLMAADWARWTSQGRAA